MSLIELVVERGEEAFAELPKSLRNPEAMAETIENNVRKVIIDERAVNPKYYEKMSQLLDALIKARKKEAIDYKAYLAKIVELTRKLRKPDASSYPRNIDTPARRAIYDNLGQDEEIAIKVDIAIKENKEHGFRGNHFKEKKLVNAIKKALNNDENLAKSILEIAKKQNEY